MFTKLICDLQSDYDFSLRFYALIPAVVSFIAGMWAWRCNPRGRWQSFNFDGFVLSLIVILSLALAIFLNWNICNQPRASIELYLRLQPLWFMLGFTVRVLWYSLKKSPSYPTMQSLFWRIGFLLLLMLIIKAIYDLYTPTAVNFTLFLVISYGLNFWAIIKLFSKR